MPFKDINASDIINRTYYAGLSEKAENAVYSQFPQYGNVSVNGESSNSMIITIIDYSRETANYDAQGNIISYMYSLRADFDVNNETKTIHVRRTLSSEITEEQCQDSLMNDLVRNFIDKIRETM